LVWGEVCVLKQNNPPPPHTHPQCRQCLCQARGVRATATDADGCSVGHLQAARCAFFDRTLHSRMPLVPTPARLKRCHACDQWHSSRVSTILPVHTVNCVQTLKAKPVRSDRFLCGRRGAGPSAGSLPLPLATEPLEAWCGQSAGSLCSFP
jgi:hypothetical protein